MAEYIEREDAEKTIETANNMVKDLLKYTTRLCAIMHTIAAADVVEVKRGKWEEVEVAECEETQLLVAGMRCSVCKRYRAEIYHYGNPTEMAHYCPNCGAKMEVEE